MRTTLREPPWRRRQATKYGFAYVLWTQVAHLVSEKMALREQVERQQEQIELLEDRLRDMGPLPWP